MTDAVQTYDPINTLKLVAENIWIVDGPIIHMQQYGVSIPFPTRMTVIRLANGDLFLHSPIRLDGGLQDEIEALGTVRHLVSPNKIHYACIGEWGDAYPNAIKPQKVILAHRRWYPEKGTAELKRAFCWLC